METQKTIAMWADAAFGPTASVFTSAARANQEMAELIKALAEDPNHPKAPEEAADVVITLARAGEKLGVDLISEGHEIAMKWMVPPAIETDWVMDANWSLAGLLAEARSLDYDADNAEALAQHLVAELDAFVQTRGQTMQELIDAKMAINRRREWRRDGHGHGYHLKLGESLAVASLRETAFAEGLDKEP